MESADPTARYVVVNENDEVLYNGQLHDVARSTAEKAALATQSPIRLYQEIARFESEIKVVMRTPGE